MRSFSIAVGCLLGIGSALCGSGAGIPIEVATAANSPRAEQKHFRPAGPVRHVFDLLDHEVELIPRPLPDASYLLEWESRAFSVGPGFSLVGVSIVASRFYGDDERPFACELLWRWPEDPDGGFFAAGHATPAAGLVSSLTVGDSERLGPAVDFGPVLGPVAKIRCADHDVPPEIRGIVRQVKVYLIER